MEELVHPSEVNYDTDYFLCYVTTINEKVHALALLNFGIEIFEEARQITDFDKLKYLSNISPQEGEKNGEEILKTAKAFLKDALIDDIRFGIFFEFYMKGLLLLDDYLIHSIKSGKPYNLMSKDQLTKPIPVLEFLKIKREHVEDSDRKIKVRHSHLKKNTLTFTNLLEPAYQEIIKLPMDILPIAREIKDRRNTLHFDVGRKFEAGKERIQEIETLMNFVSLTAKPLMYALKLELKKEGIPGLGDLIEELHHKPV